jgi:putative transposase
MWRNQRVAVVGVPEHLVQLGNTKQVIFASDDGMKVYVTW